MTEWKDGRTWLESPTLYSSIVPRLPGASYVFNRLREFWSASGVTLDVGAGTGTAIGFLAQGAARWIATDIDLGKLDRLKQRWPNQPAVQADATALPFGSRACDSAVCIFMAHHLDDVELRGLLSELVRVVRGRVLVADALDVPGRLLSRWLWRIDRGAFPRRRDHLVGLLSESFRIERMVDVTYLHHYLFCDCVPAAGPAATTQVGVP